MFIPFSSRTLTVLPGCPKAPKTAIYLLPYILFRKDILAVAISFILFT